MSDPASHVQRTERFDLNALYETSRLLSASLDLTFVLNNLLLTAMSKLLVTRGAVLLYEPVESAYRAVSAKGIPGIQAGDWVRPGQIEADRLLRGAEVPPVFAERRIELVLPVTFGHREIGLILLGKKATGQAFEAAELDFIQSLVHMTSAAVHNSLMVEELKLANRDLDGKIQQLNTLFDLSQEFNATLDRARLVKLLSFALMGQMLVGKYLLLLRHTHAGADAAGPDLAGAEGAGADAGEGGVEDGVAFRVVTAKGVPPPRLEGPLLDALCELDELLLLQEEAGAPPAWEELRARGLSLVIPLIQHGETCGALCLGPKMTGQAYGADDIEFLGALGNLALVSLQNSYLVEAQIEKERLQEEMRLARQIQERLLPQTIPTFKGGEVAALAIPSRAVGGDYFEVCRLEKGRLMLAVADVTGKGVPASLLMANLQACLQVLRPMDVSIDEVTAHVNRVICDNTSFDKFITFFVGVYHEATGEFEYVNAGHNPPMLLRAGGALELLETGGLLLGVMKGMPYQRGTTTLAPGDVLALFTDGVTEAMSPDEEEYGEEQLEKVLRETRHLAAQAILNAVHEDVKRFTKNPPSLSDDLTMLVVKVTE